jgi:RNA polymerase sporulation-specific sigma factor
MKNGDTAARSRLIEHNLRLVAHIVKKYAASADEQDELISVGTIGLIKAVSSFDHSKGAKFATYASRCIENEILMQFRAAKKSAGDIYISEPVETDKDGNSLTLMDIIDDGADIHEQVDILIRSRQLYSFLRQCLDERSFEIIVYRYGLYGTSPHTQNETAAKLGISRSYVSRLEKKAISDLKKMFDASEL